jgi:hypothetical protein
MVTENIPGYYGQDVLSTLVPLSALAHFDCEVSPIFYVRAGATFTHAYISQRRVWV